MRRDFANLLHNQMQHDDNVYLITADLGYGLWDKIRDDFPARFYNVGSSELTGLGICVGLAMEGKLPYFYSITPFALYRPFEIIRNYLDHECIKVNIVGGGRCKDYGYLGFSHWAEEDKQIMSCFKNIVSMWPEDDVELLRDFDTTVYSKTPCYINLKK